MNESEQLFTTASLSPNSYCGWKMYKQNKIDQMLGDQRNLACVGRG